MIEIVAINSVSGNDNNPRTIKSERYRKLVKSIKAFPEMLNLRPIVVNDEMVVLGGNMRLKACIDAGLQVIPIIKASNLSKEQQDEFIIKDNINFGEWDIDMIANDWELEKIVDWGFIASNLPPEIEEEEDYEEENPIYPIAPRISEKHDYVMIVCNNSIDYNNLLMRLNLEYNKDYKCERVGMGRVITFEQFNKIID